jgi:hypothetical protein
MKRSEMVCRTCLNFEEGWCRLGPEPVDLHEKGVDWKAPIRYWCGSGRWKGSSGAIWEWGDWTEETEEILAEERKEF